MAQAAAIDARIDDGMLTIGNVLSQCLTWFGVPDWDANVNPQRDLLFGLVFGNARLFGQLQERAMVNRGLSFKFQAGD